MVGKPAWTFVAMGFAVVLLVSSSRGHAQIVLPGSATLGGPAGYHYGRGGPAHRHSTHHPTHESDCDTACKNLSCGEGMSCDCTHKDGKLQTSCRR
jgi:hypothetical protein